MATQEQFQAGLNEALQQQREQLETFTLQQCFDNGWFTSISAVRTSQPNNFKGCIVNGPNGSGFILLGRTTSANIAVGAIPKKSWVVVKTTNAQGETRFKLSENTQLMGIDKLVD